METEWNLLVRWIAYRCLPIKWYVKSDEVSKLIADDILIGFDGTVHLSKPESERRGSEAFHVNTFAGEEVENAATTVPQTMVLTVLINGILAFGFMIALLFSIGDIDKALNTPTGFPLIYIFHEATGSNAATTVMMSAIIIIAFFSTVGILASTSRLTWAFARDKGLPFSDFFAYVRWPPLELRSILFFSFFFSRKMQNEN